MAGVVCPHCNVSTAFTPVSITGKGTIWEYSSDDKRVYGRVSIDAVVPRGARTPRFAIVACQAADCGRLFVAEEDRAWPGGWRSVWPLPGTAVTSEVPETVRAAFGEALLCLAVKAHGGCLLMCRTALIRIQRERKVGSLEELEQSGAISRSLREQADEVRLWANVVGHEDFSEEALTPEACQELVDYMSSLLHALYVQPARLARHREQRKQAKSRGKED